METKSSSFMHWSARQDVSSHRIAIILDDRTKNLSFTGRRRAAPPPPILIAVSPSTVALPGTGTLLTLTGSDFADGATVTVDGQPCSDVTWVDATTVTCRAPAGSAPGPVPIMLTNPGGASTQSTLYYEGLIHCHMLLPLPPPPPSPLPANPFFLCACLYA